MNQPITDEGVLHECDLLEPHRSSLSTDQDRIVARTTGHSMSITVPGDRLPTMGGLTLVSARPTHRRQVHMTELMIAGLIASEASIHGRCGFAPACWFHHIAVAVHPAIPAPDGRLELRRFEDATELLPAIQRTPLIWQSMLRRWSKMAERVPVWTAIHPGLDGLTDGQVTYRIDSVRVDHTAQHVVHVIELAGQDQARVALWLVLLILDLVRTVVDAMLRGGRSPKNRYES